MVSVVAFSFSNNRATLRPLTKEPKDSGLILGVRETKGRRKTKGAKQRKLHRGRSRLRVASCVNGFIDLFISFIHVLLP